jgi:hypothetical protein
MRSFREVHKDSEEVYLARAGQSFHAERRLPAGNWEIRGDPGVTPDQAYPRGMRRINELDFIYWDTVPLLGLADLSMNLVSPFNLRVARLERTTENGRHVIVLELEGWPGHPWFRTNTMWISTDDFTTPRHATVGEKGNVWRNTAGYETREGVPLLKSSRGEGQWDNGTLGKTAIIVRDRKFDSVPDSEFTRAALLGDSPVEEIVRPSEPIEVSPLLKWYRVPLLLSAVFLVAGSAIDLLARKSAKGQ